MLVNALSDNRITVVNEYTEKFKKLPKLSIKIKEKTYDEITHKNRILA
jgi:hypothetical protein